MIKKLSLFVVIFVPVLVGVGVVFFGRNDTTPATPSMPSIQPLSPSPIQKDIDLNPIDTNAVELVPHEISLASGKTFSLNVPRGFSIVPAAEGLKRIRFMAISPDNRLFLTDLFDLSDNTKGKIYILEDFDQDAKKFHKVTMYLANLRNPNSVAFYKDTEGVYWLYVALTDKLVRYKYGFGDNSPQSLPEVLASFPDYGLSYKYGGWHLTRTIAIRGDKLYLSVGSSCNVCEEKESESVRATIVEMDMDGKNQKIYAKGLRNAVGLKWVGDKLFATNMGADHLGDDTPVDTLYQIKEGADYGWPYCYEQNGKVYIDNTQTWKRKTIECEDVPVSYGAFEAHSAPLGLEYVGQQEADPRLRDYFLVALHGSGQVRIGKGYSIVRIKKDRIAEEIVSGFLNDGVRYGRPVDIMMAGDNSFFVTDDFAGVVYYVYKAS